MKAEHRLIDKCGQRQTVENLCAVSPHIDAAIFTQTLVVEPVCLSNLSALMVASYECNLVGIPDLECKQQQECLNRVKPSVYEVAHEQVIRARTLAAYLEKLHQIVKLAVDVTANLQKVRKMSTYSDR